MDSILNFYFYNSTGTTFFTFDEWNSENINRRIKPKSKGIPINCNGYKVYFFDIKQLHYKTIIFHTNAHPIIRNTILYNKFSCYEDGVIDREERSLIKDNSKYYTVENLKLDDNTTPIKIEKQDLNNINDERTRLNNVIQEVLKIFNKIDFDIEYIKDGDITRADLFLAPPLSTLDILKLEELTQKFDFYYTAITIKEKINRKNRNSKLEITLNS